jgi:hypothetical protein
MLLFWTTKVQSKSIAVETAPTTTSVVRYKNK